MEGRVVIIAMDGSDHAVYAFQWYVEHLKKDYDKVVLLCCVQPFNPYRAECSEVPFILDKETAQRCLDEEREALTITLQQYAELLKQNNIKGTVKSCHTDHVGVGIINTSKDMKAGMIVMGSRGLGIIRRTLMGSVSDYVLRNAEIPITIVRRK